MSRQDATTAKLSNCKKREAYQNVWKVPLMSTCSQSPGYCCYAMWCGQCASFSLRKQALYGDMSRYICCNGMCPCSGRMGERKCPSFCLCLESFVCFAQSVATTRWMIQDELHVQTTKCDNCIIGTMIALQYISCICHILACFFNELHEVAMLIDCLADITWCTVCACMQTQHKVQLDDRDAGGRPGPMTPPGVQMIPTQQPGYGPPPPMPTGHYAQAPYPPPQGYAPPPPAYYAPPAQGYPPQGHPPQGYPPQGYPPQGHPPQGYPPQGHPPQGHPPQGAYAAYPIPPYGDNMAGPSGPPGKQGMHR